MRKNGRELLSLNPRFFQMFTESKDSKCFLSFRQLLFDFWRRARNSIESDSVSGFERKMKRKV